MSFNTLVNQNKIQPNLEANVLFIDMNSFFASCEQQVNYWLRGRPVAVCVYTGKYGCIISPSVEAKKFGIKVGMRLNEAIKLCPELVPLETNSARYREYHVKIINVLKKYSEDVIPKSIDEAVVSFKNYKLVHKNLIDVAKRIKHDIKTEVGDWLRCSIGIAPNSFLAKLASDIQKPDGLTVITSDNIDEVLKKLKLTDLPGIAGGMSERLIKSGIDTPLKLRHTSPQMLQIACKSIVGLHWHYRLNFSEVDFSSHSYKSMQAQRHLSPEQRKSAERVWDMLSQLCITLERRMAKHEVFAKHLFLSIRYQSGAKYATDVRPEKPIQDGMELLTYLKKRIKQFENNNQCEDVINTEISSMGIGVSDFISDQVVQFHLFENSVKKDTLRKTMYDIKERFGSKKIVRAIEVKDEEIKDVIGFGSVKDIHDDLDGFNKEF